MRDNDFKNKNKLGRKVEEVIAEYYRKHIDKKAHLPRVFVKGYDIVCPEVGNIEVKEDRMAHETGYYALEFQNYKEEPSGYMGTTAKEFVIVDFDNVVMTRTENIKYIVDESETKREIPMGDRAPDGRQCRGWLVPRRKILYSPFVTVVDRWFPHWRIINGRVC